MNSITSRLPSIRFPSFSGVDYHEFKRKVSKAIKFRSLYNRITLTPFTLIYSLLVVLTCIIMAALQGVSYSDNTAGVNAISPLIHNANLTNGLTLNANGALYYCSHIANQNAAQCTAVVTNPPTNSTAGGGTGFVLAWRRDLQQVPRANTEYSRIEARRPRSSAKWKRAPSSDVNYKARQFRRRSGPSQAVLPAPAQSQSPAASNTTTTTPVQNVTCAKALLWLEGALNDERREDAVMLTFQFWLFTLSAIAILSESLPHLGAALVGHIFGTGWAASRIRLSYDNMNVYQNQVVAGACGGSDFLGTWWQIKISHMIPIAVVNGIVLAFMLFLTYKIYRVYSKQTFNSVGATPAVERILKIVLLFSVNLQVTVFFVIASAAMWINKATNGIFSFLATNDKGFLAASALTLILVFPWMFVGLVCIRRECQWRFLAFCVISVFLITIFTMMFWSETYRFIFTSWPFFAVVCVVAYVMVIISTILAVWCRFNFGQGFAHFIQVSEVLEDMDFPPVSFSKEGGAERGMRTVSGQVLQIPPLNRSNTGLRSMRFLRSSVYSNHNLATVKLSSSQPLYSDIINTKVPTPTSPTFQRGGALTVTQRLRRVFEYRRSNASNGSSGSEGASVPPVPPMPVIPPLPEVSPSVPAPRPARAPAPKPPSPQPILTSQIAQQSKLKLQPVRPSNRPPPLALSPEDDAFRGRRSTDRNKRRSRSVSLGRSGHAREPMQTITEAVLDLAPGPRSAKTRPLPIRPLPKPPATAPLSLENEAGPSSAAAPTTGGLVRRGGLRDNTNRQDARSFNEQQW